MNEQADKPYTCTKCGEAKTFDEMSKHHRMRNGVHSWCKACMNARARKRVVNKESVRRYNLKTKYGITIEQYNKMLSDQGLVCAICRAPMAKPCVDHDHATGLVRGVLCQACNIKLHAVDSWPFLESAIQYIKRSKVAA